MRRNGRFLWVASVLGVMLFVPGALHAQGSSLSGFDADYESKVIAYASGDAAQADVSSLRVVGNVPGYSHRKPRTMSGMLSARYTPEPGSDNPFFLVAASYPVPYPMKAALPTLEYVPGLAATATCPGPGKAAAGRLCIYGFNTDNVSAVGFSGGGQTRYGFSLDVFTTTPAIGGWIIAVWTVAIP